MLGPFIDTVVICTMTALVVIVSGAYAEPAAGEGVEMTRWAFAHTLSWFPIILNVSVLLFAYSTMISWSYYGEKAWQYIFGQSPTAAMSYRVLFLLFVILGAVSSLQNVIDFSDLMILSMAFPNVIGGIILAPRVKALLQDYWARYKNNEFKTYS
jgi:AGCS family alanine or glycine:cation symporter